MRDTYKDFLEPQFAEALNYVLNIIADDDPNGFLVAFAGKDEYDIEAASFLAKIHTCNTAKDAEMLMKKVFCFWFGENYYGQFNGKGGLLLKAKELMPKHYFIP